MFKRAAIVFLGWCGAATSGCATNVAQTAEYQPAVTFVCGAPNSAVSLPAGGAFSGTDRVIDSPLVSTSYTANAGPGILVASRDAFRLYVNGDLLLESQASLAPSFVGVSFMPGKNVVSVVAVGAERQPLIAARIDELEQPYVTDTSWKASTAPGAGWMDPAFDDGSWVAATDHGLVDNLSQCASKIAPLVGAGVHLIGATDPSAHAVAFRYRFDIAPNGFGAAATGGRSAPVTLAKDIAALRALVENDDTERVVALPEGLLDFRPNGAEALIQATCPTACTTSTVTQYIVLPTGTDCSANLVSIKRNERQIHIRSNKSIVGLGRGTQLRGAWFDLVNSSNIVLRNLAWFDVNPALIEAGDGLSFDATTKVWVDHCTFKWVSDGFTDLSNSSTQTTISWALFDGENAAECRSRHLRSNELVDSEATYHHSFWRHVDGRAPFVHGATARAHLYNNVVLDAVDYAVGSGCHAQVLLEGSYFEEVAAPSNIRDCVETPGLLGLISATAGSNLYGTGTGTHKLDGTASQEPRDSVFIPPYTYRLEPAAEIRFRVQERAGAGSRWALPLNKN